MLSAAVCVCVLIAEEIPNYVQVHTKYGKCHNERFRMILYVIRFQTETHAERRTVKATKYWWRLIWQPVPWDYISSEESTVNEKICWCYCCWWCCCYGVCLMLIAVCFENVVRWINIWDASSRLKESIADGSEFDGWWLVSVTEPTSRLWNHME